MLSLVKFTKITILLKLTLLHGCFSRFLNCTNGTKARNASHISSNKVFYISPDGCCTRFDMYYFKLYLFYDINDSILKLMMAIASSILVGCNFRLKYYITILLRQFKANENLEICVLVLFELFYETKHFG